MRHKGGHPTLCGLGCGEWEGEEEACGEWHQAACAWGTAAVSQASPGTLAGERANSVPCLLLQLPWVGGGSRRSQPSLRGGCQTAHRYWLTKPRSGDRQIQIPVLAFRLVAMGLWQAT